MSSLEGILKSIWQKLDRKEKIRERVLPLARQLIRESATLIKNAHRKEWDEAQKRGENLIRAIADLKRTLAEAPDLWFAGFVQDALKEVAEACIVYALLVGQPVPSPEELGIDDAPYLNGLLEAMGELRRAALDALRSGNLEVAERFLSVMDEVYFAAMTFDQADAVTQGARRRTDNLRVILERTRSDITLAHQYLKLAKLLPKIRGSEPFPSSEFNEISDSENEQTP